MLTKLILMVAIAGFMIEYGIQFICVAFICFVLCMIFSLYKF